MHLLHCYYENPFNLNSLHISLKACIGQPPRYAILSHRWAAEPEDEVTFEDMTSRHESSKSKRGYQKIIGCCLQALRDGYNWVWIDTCCIDKRSSAELSEAINSMYSWYENSEICYAFLEDVSYPDDTSAFMESSWFKRGWTLQELIAPAEIEFFSKDWRKIGSKADLSSTLSKITRVNEFVLAEGLHVYKASIAEKMSWASQRETTRPEDKAYSLMGIFGVNMPTLYGEGSRAFTRLQYEIMRVSNDHTIFTWQRKSLTAGLLAESPDEFSQSAIWRPLDFQAFVAIFSISTFKPDFAPTNFGMHIQLPLAPVPEFNGYYIGFLACTSKADPHVNWRAVKKDLHLPPEAKLPFIFLRRVPGGFPRQFMRTSIDNCMMGSGNPTDYECELEPIWISLMDDITPLVCKPLVGQLPSPSDILVPMGKAEDLVTIIMERRHHNLKIVTGYPPETFSRGNELTLKMAGTAAQTLRVMIIQNKRGRGDVAIVFFLIGSNLCLACSQTLANDDAERVYNRILAEGTTFTGFLSIPFNSYGESSMYRGGFFISLECVNVGALMYRFTIGPAHRDTSVPAGNTARGRAIQILINLPVPSDFFTYQLKHRSQNIGGEVGEVLLAFWPKVEDQTVPQKTPAAEKRLELLHKMWETTGDFWDDDFEDR